MNNIVVSSSVNGQTLAPTVVLVVGQQAGELTPEIARDYALSILTAAAIAEIEAKVVRWAEESLNISRQDALLILIAFREIREKHPQGFNVVVRSEELSYSPDEIRARSLRGLSVAAKAETECLLIEFLSDKLGQSKEVVEDILQDFREQTA